MKWATNTYIREGLMRNAYIS